MDRYMECYPEDAPVYLLQFNKERHICVHCSVIVWQSINRNPPNIWIKIMWIAIHINVFTRDKISRSRLWTG